MSTQNQSPSYNKMRDAVRKWLSTTTAGKQTVKKFQEMSGLQTVGKVLTDDSWTSFEDIYTEHKDDVMIAANCAEARSSFDLARQSNSHMSAPVSDGSKMLRFFSPPMWYFLRRQVQTQDPDYWNNPRTVLQEALKNEEWLVVPRSYVLGLLEELSPKTEKVTLATS